MTKVSESPAQLFHFEGATVRVSVTDDGEAWFVANDVCAVLGYSNARDALVRHVDVDDSQKRPTLDEFGRSHSTNCINESGMYALILGSRLEAAKRFKRWVTAEVLPSVRKTGQYSGFDGTRRSSHLQVAAYDAPDIVRAIQLASDTVLRVAGVKPEIVAAETLQLIQDETGLHMERLRKVLPANEEPLSSMNATQLGKELGLSARDVNQRLATLGLQFKNPRGEWELTEAGKAHGEALPYSTGRHAGYQVLWARSALDALRSEVAA